MGVVIAVAFLAAILWLFVSWGWIRMERSDTVAWVILSMITVRLTIGISWSAIRRRITGQVDVTDAHVA